MGDGRRSGQTPRSADGPARERRPTWAVATIAGLFGLFYAYAVWSGVSQLVQSVQFASSLDITLTLFGWVLWSLTIVLPIALFAVALSIAKNRSLSRLAVLLLVGLSIVAVFWLDATAYASTNTAALLAV